MPYAGQHGELPFQDPWWKILGIILIAVGIIVGAVGSVLASKKGQEVNPQNLNGFLRCHLLTWP